MNLIYLFLSVVYTTIVFYFLAGLTKLNRKKSKNRDAEIHNLTVTVLVPARNEERTIVRCLESLAVQTYPHRLYQVIVIDDHSTDRTAEIVERFIAGKSNFKLLKHRNHDLKPTYKKQALNFAISEVKSEIVMTIDADCFARPEWIGRIVSHYREDTGLVAGLISFSPEHEKNLFHKLQTLEFAGIVFCGVGSVGNRKPIICNGSNLSYRLKAFHDAGGYDGHLHLASGDDDLLLQNIHRKTSWKIDYALDSESINYTAPVESLGGFLNQRSRWASKSLHYPSGWIFPLLLAIYMFYLMTLAGIPLWLLNLLSGWALLSGLILKVIPELLLINAGLKILKRRSLIRWFPIAQILQIPYIVYAGLMGFFNKFTWKEKKHVAS